MYAKLQAGDVAALDNLSAHKVAGKSEEVEARSAQLNFLSRYSPGLNPIEKAGFKFKQLLRSAKTRTARAFDQAATEASQAIAAENAQGWFRHCGYGTQYELNRSKAKSELSVQCCQLRCHGSLSGPSSPSQSPALKRAMRPALDSLRSYRW